MRRFGFYRFLQTTLECRPNNLVLLLSSFSLTCLPPLLSFPPRFYFTSVLFLLLFSSFYSHSPPLFPLSPTSPPPLLLLLSLPLLLASANNHVSTPQATQFTLVRNGARLMTTKRTYLPVTTSNRFQI